MILMGHCPLIEPDMLFPRLQLSAPVRVASALAGSRNVCVESSIAKPAHPAFKAQPPARANGLTDKKTEDEKQHAEG